MRNYRKNVEVLRESVYMNLKGDIPKNFIRSHPLYKYNKEDIPSDEIEKAIIHDLFEKHISTLSSKQADKLNKLKLEDTDEKTINSLSKDLTKTIKNKINLMNML